VANAGNYKDLCALGVLTLAAACCTEVFAASVEVQVVGLKGEPVADVAVFVEQESAAPTELPDMPATMDQRDTQFVPHMLVIRKGQSVEFPNSDVVAHHVYSFSKPNNFVLPLYKGDAHDPITFDHDGVVILGCNIHDHMLGYIVVVDTDVFGTTDESGRVSLNVDDDASQYTVHIWSPRLRETDASLKQELHLSGQEDARLTFTLQKNLRAPHQSMSEGVKWSEY
jgi:plastocyanin